MVDIKQREGYTRYLEKRLSHWQKVLEKHDYRNLFRSGYHQRLRDIYRTIIPTGSRVLEIGCGSGDLLAALNPKDGVGVDFLPEFIQKAKQKYPAIDFRCMDAHELTGLEGKYDYIILSDLINELWDVQQVIEEVAKLSSARTKVIFNLYNNLWHIPKKLAEFLRLSTPSLEQNWLTNSDMVDLLYLSGLEITHTSPEILFPVSLGFLDYIFNKVLVKIWPFSRLALTNFIIARKTRELNGSKPTVSVIVPARNEAGNIQAIFDRVPVMGGGTEIVFVEGNSSDNTYDEIAARIKMHPKTDARLIKQKGKGKGDAVRDGFDIARGDILMILDADLTVAPEDLPRFYQAIAGNKGEFINGVRLVYPMEKEAMRFLNLLGNKFFSWAFSWLMGQSIKDTLCGTKVLWKQDYERIQANRAYFGNFDPFGDFDLLFGAAYLKLKIIDVPIRYHERTYGRTNISRWSHGWLLLKMVVYAAGKIKFI